MDIEATIDDVEWDAGTDGEAFNRTFQGTVNTQSQSPFFNLPTELRLQILRELFRGSFVAILSYLRRSEPKAIAINPEVIKPSLETLLICRRLYPEAIEAFFNMTELGLTNGQHAQSAPSLLDGLYPRVSLGIRNLHIARLFCGGYIRAKPTESLPRPQMDDFISGAATLAKLPNLQSVVVGAGWDTTERMSAEDRNHAIALEGVLRDETRKLTKVGHVCLWLGWQKLEEAVGREDQALPGNFRVHRVLYQQHDSGKKYRVRDEGPNGQKIEAEGVRTPCRYCNDVAKPWDGYADPLEEKTDGAKVVEEMTGLLVG